MELRAGPAPAQGALMRKAHGEQPHARALRVLSIDGGGVRGLVPAMLLAELEARTGRYLTEVFDIVAGTSTGAVLALGLAVPGDKPGIPRWRGGDGVEVYTQRMPEIFGDRSPWQALSGVGGLLHEKYDQGPLETVLEHYFGDCRLSEALTNAIVPAYDLAGNDVLLFDSELAKRDPSYDAPMRMVLRGATAAPTYFEPEKLGPPVVPGQHVVVDGGLFANNPAVCAFMHAQSREAGADVVMVSLGTGAGAPALALDEVRSWGLAHWARPLVNLVFASASQVTHHNLRSLLGPERYFRFEPTLERHGCSHRLDDASAENISALRRAGEALIAECSAELDRVCQLLVR